MNITKEQVDKFVDTIFYENFSVIFPREHIFYEHYNVDDDYLKYRAKRQFFDRTVLQVISRFSPDLSKREVINLVLACLRDNSDEIIDWQKKHPHEKKELILCCHKQIGEGIVLGADWNRKFQFSNLCVVLTPSNGDHLFNILTAYPCPDLDESDKCWKARRKWEQSRLNSSKRHSH